MQQGFWHERWRLNQIGFHGLQVNPHLQSFWSALKLAPGSKVLAPMCGKSLDMLWLMAQGYEVIGVELSPVAVEAFFAENGLAFTRRQQGKFSSSESDKLQILCGDFFDLTGDDFKDVNAVYDRASLVALPPDMRKAYVLLLQRLLRAGTKTLLVAFDYPQQEMSGPPFSVPTAEVQALYGRNAEVELLFSQDILDQELHFRDKGLSRMQEQVYLLTAR